ncbi:MAG: NAD(P)/FAD-dependent oxidoreductase [Chloroflexi bacterium]|nr:NAD(P)/FAD-dependent oxidoreductase [Chloroflexota bacterium]MBI3040881.1 NAD(P)/FAD-dependent oxidoreductase [Chloroflexota bacterium]MBI3931664.1 NAD(P)/FAD-dependent oxidoreductase [Chloroflexota bacterium]
MVSKYDLVVIGSGSAANVAASQCRAAGWTVAVIDFRPFGGTCALRGCDPKKVLIGAADAVDQARRLFGKGVMADGLGIKWTDLMAFKRTFTDDMPAMMESSFTGRGIDTFHGMARFTGRNTIEVGDKVLEGRYILIASGAEPMTLGIDGEEYLKTSEQFLELDHLPGRIVLVGGGFIAFEFGHLTRRAGVEVTMLEQAPYVLGPFDQDLVAMLLKKSREIGIDVRTGTAVTAVEKTGESFIVRASSQGEEHRFEADIVVHAAGRVPAIKALDLDVAGVQHEAGRLKLSEFLQSVSNSAVYAAGDAAHMGPALTPVAGRDGEIAATNMLEGNHVRTDYTVVPSVVFSLPPLASVGLREDEARKKGLNFRTTHDDTSGWYTNHRVNENTAGFKILVETGSEKIIGAHLLGPHAEEVINLFALAMRAGIPANDLKRTVYAYPTATSDIAYML